MINKTIAAALALATAAGALAQYTQVDLTSYTSSDLQTYTNGTVYPTGVSPLTVGGTPFTIWTDGGLAGTTGAVQLAFPGYGYPQEVDITGLSLFGQTAIYTLCNSAFGAFGSLVGTIEVIGSGGSDQTFNLTEGYDIRDHYNGSFNNLIAPQTATAYFGGGTDRLDEQAFDLNSSFATDTITTVKFAIQGDGSIYNGEPFMASLTFGQNTPTPEPGAWAGMGVGLLGIIFSRKRRS